MCFQSADTGYIAGKHFFKDTLDEDFAVIRITTDSGKNWIEVDTSYNFLARSINSKFNRGIITSIDTLSTATIEVFNSDIMLRERFTFDTISEIVQVCIISADSIVFVGKDLEGEDIIGLMKIENNIPEISIFHPPYCENIDNIWFDDANIGWIKSGVNLIYTENLGITGETRTSCEIADFYDLDNGVVRSETGLFFTSNRGISWVPSYNPWNNGDFIINISPGLVWWGYTFGEFGSTFWLMDVNRPFDRLYCDMNFFHQSYWKAYSINDKQIYLMSNLGDIIYSLDNVNYNSIDETILQANNTVEVYPNPASDVIKISIESPNTSRIKEAKIYNNIGKIIYDELHNSESHIRINISELPEGLYHVLLTTSEGIHRSKFTKIK